jgi:amidase
MVIAPEIEAVLLDAAARLRDAGWRVEEIADVPHLQEAAKLQTVLWLGDRFAQSDALAAQDGDPGAPAGDADPRLAVVFASLSGAAAAGLGRAAVP